MDVRSVYGTEKRVIDVEGQKAIVVSLDWQKEAKFTLLHSSINDAGCVLKIDERLWGRLHAHRTKQWSNLREDPRIQGKLKVIVAQVTLSYLAEQSV